MKHAFVLSFIKICDQPYIKIMDSLGYINYDLLDMFDMRIKFNIKSIILGIGSSDNSFNFSRMLYDLDENIKEKYVIIERKKQIATYVRFLKRDFIWEKYRELKSENYTSNTNFFDQIKEELDSIVFIHEIKDNENEMDDEISMDEINKSQSQPKSIEDLPKVPERKTKKISKKKINLSESESQSEDDEFEDVPTTPKKKSSSTKKIVSKETKIRS